VADGGTLFLDEVGETSGPFQAKLLRALQEREVRPVGGSRSRAVDVRVVAATNRDLWRESVPGGFRQDLYFRLAAFPIEIPPLRERTSDVLRLARHFLALHGRAEAKPGVALSPEAERLLEAHPWPPPVPSPRRSCQLERYRTWVGRLYFLRASRCTLNSTKWCPRVVDALRPALEAGKGIGAAPPRSEPPGAALGPGAPAQGQGYTRSP